MIKYLVNPRYFFNNIMSKECQVVAKQNKYYEYY